MCLVKVWLPKFRFPGIFVYISPPVPMRFLNIDSCFWLVNILQRKFDTSSKKKWKWKSFFVSNSLNLSKSWTWDFSANSNIFYLSYYRPLCLMPYVVENICPWQALPEDGHKCRKVNVFSNLLVAYFSKKIIQIFLTLGLNYHRLNCSTIFRSKLWRRHWKL